MDSIADDPRFSHIVTDPRFRPMPKAKRKVKIDKRFSSLFTSKHFKARTDIDKRGRPVKDVTKRNKHVMERFYELSSDDSDSDDESDEENDVSGEDNHDSKEKLAVEVIDLPVSHKTEKKRKNDKSKTPQKQMKLSGKKRKLSSPNDNDPVPTSKSNPEPPRKMRLTKEDDNVSEGSIGNTLSDDEDDDEDSTSDSDTDEDDSSDPEEENLPEYTQDFDMEETTLEHKWNELHTDAVEVSESTHRLAVCNMDWDFVKAQDLFVLLKSFVPEGGRVKSVTIYPSEFGKQRMTEEALLGPKELRDLTKENENGANSTNGGTDGSVNGKKKKGKRKKAPTLMDQKQEKNAEKDIKDYETEKLREYQLNRLRYYYAVVDCDSVESADSIYHECDGKEYQLSSVRLDLRFIPDDMTFDDTPKDSFSEDQGLVDYAPNKFNSTALSQAKVEVTWDETDFDRLSRRIVGLQQKELESMVEENQYAELIAPPESDSEAESDRPDWLNEALAEEEEDSNDEDLTEEKKIQLYRKVLMEKLTEEEKQPEEDKVDQEIQWTPGLKSSAQEKLKKKKKGKELQNDIVEGYLEKKKQKKKKKLEKKKEKTSSTAEGEDQLAFSDDELPSDVDEDLKTLMEGEGVSVSSSTSKRSKKKKDKRKEELVDSETERERAELELLMMGDGDKSISKPKKVEEGKMSKRKKKKMAKLAKEKKEKEKQEFALDMDDDRFSALFTSHHFHIDPNAPQYKKTQNMMELVNEQISRKKKTKTKAVQEMKSSSVEETPDSKLVSKQLVESLKRKMKK